MRMPFVEITSLSAIGTPSPARSSTSVRKAFSSPLRASIAAR